MYSKLYFILKILTGIATLVLSNVATSIIYIEFLYQPTQIVERHKCCYNIPNYIGFRVATYVNQISYVKLCESKDWQY